MQIMDSEQSGQAIGEVLKHSTAEAHRSAETRPLQRSLVGGTLPFDTLGAYLGQLLLVHDALERACAEQIVHCEALALVWSTGIDHAVRLQADVQDHGLDPSEIEPLSSTRQLLNLIHLKAEHEPIALIGLLYVLEGSMNGNRFIVRVIDRQHGREQRQGYSYFDPYGESQSGSWKSFKDRLNACELSGRDREQIVDAAHEMFSAIGAISDEVYAQADV